MSIGNQVRCTKPTVESINVLADNLKNLAASLTFGS